MGRDGAGDWIDDQHEADSDGQVLLDLLARVDVPVLGRQNLHDSSKCTV